MRSEHAAVGVPGSPSGTGAVPRREVDAVFGALFTQHRHRVFSTALRLTGRPADAEDLTADTFLQAYRSLSGFDYERLDTLRPRAWLSAIVVNLWRNQCRAPSRRPRPAESPGAMGPVPVDPHPGVEEQIKTREDGRELAAALLTLPERQRVAVVLRHIGGLPIAEVAEAMECPAGTAKSLVSRALDRLRAVNPAGNATVGAGTATVPVSPVSTAAAGRATRAPAMTGLSRVRP